MNALSGHKADARVAVDGVVPVEEAPAVGAAQIKRGKTMGTAKHGRSCRSVFAIFILGWVAWLNPAPSIAQDYPNKAVRIIVPNSAGSVGDTVSRVIFAKVSEVLGQQFVIDNRPGAGGNIGAEIAAKSPADGYTLLFGTDGIMAISPFLYSKLGFDPLRDFAGVSMLTKVPYVIIVHPSLGVRSMDEFLRLARSRPGQINYSSGGNGHPTHIDMEKLVWKAGIQLVHVPYKGTGPAMQAVMTGEVGASALGIGLALPYIRSGKVIAIAFGGPRNADVLPGVPDLSKLVPDSEYVPWQALFAPAGTPKAVIDRLNSAVAKALAAADVKSRMADVGMTAVGSSPGELEQLVSTDQAVGRELVKKLGLKVD